MKKLLIVAAATALLTTSAFAGTAETFYVKANGGMNKMRNFKQDLDLGPVDATVNLKSKTAGFAEIGVGYNIMDNVRADLTFAHFFNPEHKATSSISHGTITANGTMKLKANINTLMVNGYVDVFDVSVVKFFLGAGVGVAQVKANVTAASSVSSNGQIVFSRSGSFKAKKTNNFTYALIAGTSLEVAPGVNAELAYSWRDMGKAAKGLEDTKFRYRGHNGSVGVRFDI